MPATVAFNAFPVLELTKSISDGQASNIDEALLWINLAAIFGGDDIPRWAAIIGLLPRNYSSDRLKARPESDENQISWVKDVHDVILVWLLRPLLKGQN